MVSGSVLTSVALYLSTMKPGYWARGNFELTSYEQSQPQPIMVTFKAEVFEMGVESSSYH